MGRVLRHIAGWGFLVLGVVGLVLPGLQGVLLLALGALLLAPDVPIFARLVAWAEGRFPSLRDKLDRVRRWLARDASPPGA